MCPTPAVGFVYTFSTHLVTGLADPTQPMGYPPVVLAARPLGVAGLRLLLFFSLLLGVECIYTDEELLALPRADHEEVVLRTAPLPRRVGPLT